MFTDPNSSLRALLIAIVCALLLIACDKKDATLQVGTDRTKHVPGHTNPVEWVDDVRRKRGLIPL